MEKKLVILTTHFGTNFSGGSIATCEIFSRIEDQFEEIVVLGTVLGDHPFKHLRFIKYQNWFDAIQILKNLKREQFLFYGDFYNSILFSLVGVDFYFTYHDNWPELGQTSLSNFWKSLFYVPVYKKVFKTSQHVFVVSEKKLAYVNQLNEKTSLVRNGFAQKGKKNTINQSKRNDNVLMVGNIDKRKYTKALVLFNALETTGTSFHIDIYGEINDQKIVEALMNFPFVTIKGFSPNIPYGDYAFLLHTSVMENMPIVFCEALAEKLPVLTFDVGGSSEIINDTNGMLVPCYDIEKMKDSFLRLFQNKEKYTHSETQLSEFSWDIASTKYLNKITS